MFNCCSHTGFYKTFMISLYIIISTLFFTVYALAIFASEGVTLSHPLTLPHSPQLLLPLFRQAILLRKAIFYIHIIFYLSIKIGNRRTKSPDTPFRRDCKSRRTSARLCTLKEHILVDGGRSGQFVKDFSANKSVFFLFLL